ncbi:MAG: hypothetical protein IKP71_09455, partial [Candidatus Riflebacteria bacterium]|nr:hypothetical protein [Candidatus Riflebacteria bacterium]
HAGTIGGLAVTVISPVAKDYGNSTVNMSAGNVFSANELNVRSDNTPNLTSSMNAWGGGVLGVGVGDVSAYEYGSSNLTVNKGSKYNVAKANYDASVRSYSKQQSDAYTGGLIDVKANRVDAIASQTVNVNVEVAKNNYADNTILNVRGENNAKSVVDVDGISVGLVATVVNNKAEGDTNLLTNVNVKGIGEQSSLSQINVVAKSEAEHALYANGDGGGLVAVSPYAGSVESNINLQTNANLSGNMMADKIHADAVGVADYKGTTKSTQGSFAGGNGAITKSKIKVDTDLKVFDNAKLNAKEIYLVSGNDIKTGFAKDNYNTKSKMYGGFGGSVARSEQIIDATTLVDIGKKATLSAEDLINIDAVTKTNLKNSSISAGGGIGSHPSNRSDNEVTLNNIIKTEDGSSIKTTKKYGDINIATSYDFVASYTAYSEVEGSGGGSTSATSKYIINNYNFIDLYGDVYSKNYINIYTDRNTYGVKSNFNLYGNAEAYTRSIIPWKTDAILESEINRSNIINVNSNSLVRSVRDITMNADSGNFYYKPYTKEYTWYDEETNKRKPVTTVDQGEKDDKITDNNSINVDGKVIAGVENKVTIDINGTVLFDESATGNGIVRTPTITCSSDEYSDKIKYGTMEYANRLYNRFKEIEKLISENKGTLVGDNYESEKNRLIAEMEKYGLYDSKTNSLISNMLV